MRILSEIDRAELKGIGRYFKFLVIIIWVRLETMEFSIIFTINGIRIITKFDSFCKEKFDIKCIIHRNKDFKLDFLMNSFCFEHGNSLLTPITSPICAYIFIVQ